MNTSKKIAVISGGSGYLGSSIVQTLILNNFSVIVLEKEKRNVPESENIHFKFGDISVDSDVKKIADEVRKEYGEIHTIIHAASSPLIRRPVLSLSDVDFEKQLLVNVFGGFHFFKYFSEFLSENGSIIGITSSAILPKSLHSKSGSYVAAKYGLQGLLRSISSESLFRVYSIAPAFMPGGLNHDIPEIARDMIIKKSRPEDITNAEEVSRAVLLAVNDSDKKWSGKTISIPGFLISEM